MKSFARNIVLLLLSCFLGFGWLIWNFNRPPFDLLLLQQLRPGMSQTEVRGILGAPNSDFGNEWAYFRTLAWPIVYVRFDQDGKLTTSEYDF